MLPLPGRGRAGSSPGAVSNTLSCLAGRTRAEAHADRVRSPGGGDTSPAGGHQQHTCESSSVTGVMGTTETPGSFVEECQQGAGALHWAQR